MYRIYNNVMLYYLNKSKFHVQTINIQFWLMNNVRN